MCTHDVRCLPVSGSGKGPSGWQRVTRATVSVDHPYAAALDHTLNIDLVDEEAGPAARVAVELSRESARRLVAAMQAALDAADALIGPPL